MQLINPEVRIETTNLCNYNCKTCPREKMTRPKVTMGLQHFDMLAQEAHSLGADLISVFGYGEPLLDPTLPEKIQICSVLGMETFITTNASLLNEEMARDLEVAGLTHIRISVHALNAEDYADVHGTPLDWDGVVLNNILTFLNHNTSIETSISVIPVHGESVKLIRQTWEGLVDHLEIWKPHNWVSGRQYRKVDIKKRTCGRPHKGPVQIQADGTVIPCCFLTNSELVLGDTYKNSIEEILNGEPYKKLRIAHETGVMDGLPCEQCDQLNIESESPLLYSSRDKTKTIGCTSSAKFKLED